MTTTILSLPEEFEEFIRNFEKAERDTIVNSGVDMEAATVICGELSELLRQAPDLQNLEALPDPQLLDVRSILVYQRMKVEWGYQEPWPRTGMFGIQIGIFANFPAIALTEIFISFIIHDEHGIPPWSLGRKVGVWSSHLDRRVFL